MADTTNITGNVNIGGSVSVGSLSVRSGTLSVDRLAHRIASDYSQAIASVVASETKVIRSSYATGSVKAFIVSVDTAPTGGDKAFTVDLQKSTGAGAYASVLSAVITINSSSTAKTAYSATISSASYSANDLFKVIVTTSGSTGTQGYGVQATAFFDENPS